MNEPFLASLFPRTDFTQQEQETIIAEFQRVTFRKHDFLLTEGTTENHYWFIERGFVRSYAVDTAGNDISTNFYGAGDVVIDWPSFFQRQPTRENIQALTDCVGWQLDFATFQQLFHSIEAFREAGRARLVASYFELKQNRVSMITDPAKVRYQRLLTERPDVLQNVSLKQIASYLGITDTSLSRIRKEFTEGK
ncbi:MAG: Crp/Fnr family transcriptional regulator [Tunicatimonas sp.]